MSDFLFIILLAAATGVGYYIYSRCNTVTDNSDNDYESEGTETTKIRHERGI